MRDKKTRKDIDHVMNFTKFQNRKTATNGVAKPPIRLICSEDFAMILLHILAKSGPQRRPRKGQKRPKTDQENLGQILPNPYVYVVSRPLIFNIMNNINIYKIFYRKSIEFSIEISIEISIEGFDLS